ncbi:4'-phosphopantetheinyl transferase family protein [Chitinophaga polysaccharea]|uniref:4'-phosphopantetheinyl transferase family protein n=1 Tax=Chitinophaga polysaccharea TaxID=1293035 RepID=UPI00115BE011|nr:4'-phosphopantetheinyl transferase superfamily protein [Chitinophaga polysaccharea]
MELQKKCENFNEDMGPVAITVYYTCYDTPMPAPVFSRLAAVLPENLRAAVYRYRRWEDAHAALLGKHLLRYSLLRRQLPYTLADIEYTANRRPFINGAPDFNITHSATAVAFAVAEKGRVGIDIEKPQLLPMDDFRQQFSGEEWYNICQDPAPPAIFYRYWTKKEAVLKAAGTGLNDALHLLNTTTDVVHYDQHTWQLHTLSILPPYICHLACSEINVAISVHQVNISELAADAML